LESINPYTPEPVCSHGVGVAEFLEIKKPTLCYYYKLIYIDLA
jgi:hypothetical protein